MWLQNLDIVKMKIFRACTQCYPTIMLVPVNLIWLVFLKLWNKQISRAALSIVGSPQLIMICFSHWRNSQLNTLCSSSETLCLLHLVPFFREEQTVINDKISDNAFVQNREKIISKASVVNFYSYSFPWTSSSVPSHQS